MMNVLKEFMLLWWRLLFLLLLLRNASSFSHPDPRDTCGCPFIKPRDICKGYSCELLQPHPQHHAEITSQQLSNISILVIGDSLALQLSRALKCYTMNMTFIKITEYPLYTFPIYPHSMERQLRDVIGSSPFSVVIISLGIWYNWDPLQNNLIPRNISEYSSAMILEKICPIFKTKYLDLQDTDSFQISEMIRTSCKQLLNEVSFLSGLKRLKQILYRYKDIWPPVLWKDIPPQHFPNSLSGMYNGRVGNPCAPVKNKTLSYSRNFLVDKILGSGWTVPIVRTWEADVDGWTQHVYKDCTHYCVPSELTGRWARSVLLSIAVALKGS